MKKHFILALQPHEQSPTHRAWSPGRDNLHTLSFCVTLLLLMGLAFPITTPSEWQEKVRVGLLRISYSWQSTPLLTASRATYIYTDIFSKTPKTGCKDAPERDWKVVCPMISSQMSNNLDCNNANPQGKADILKNFENSKTTYQYQCLYGV
jgi:hypothetical protein